MDSVMTKRIANDHFRCQRRWILAVSLTVTSSFGPGFADDPRQLGLRKSPQRLPSVSTSDTRDASTANVDYLRPREISAAPNPSSLSPSPPHDKAGKIQRCVDRSSTGSNASSKLINPTGAARDFIQVSNESEEPIRWLRSSSSFANAEVARRLLKQANREYRVGAWMSAESTAWEALRWSAEAIDLSDRETAKTRLGGRMSHATKQLKTARDAIREARDFSGVYGAIDEKAINRMALSHETNVLDNAETVGLTGMDAADRYLDEARVALAGIAARSVEAAQSMDLLAAIHLGQADAAKLPSATALCLRRAALQGQPSNASLASRLGIHLAEVGLLDEATWVLEHSLSLEHDPATADALVAVFRRTGQREQAARLLAVSQNRLQEQNANAVPRIPEITELSPDEFASISKPVMNTSRSEPLKAMLASSRKDEGQTQPPITQESAQSVLQENRDSKDSSGKPGMVRRFLNSFKRVW